MSELARLQRDNEAYETFDMRAALQAVVDAAFREDVPATIAALNSAYSRFRVNTVTSTRIGRALTSDRKSTRLNSSHIPLSRMPSSA